MKKEDKEKERKGVPAPNGCFCSTIVVDVDVVHAHTHLRAHMVKDGMGWDRMDVVCHLWYAVCSCGQCVVVFRGTA